MPATLERFVPQAIEGLVGLISCDAASCGIITDLVAGKGSVVGHPIGYHTPDRLQTSIRLGEPELRSRIRPRRFNRFSAMFNRTEFRNSAMYNENLRPQGIEDVIAMGFVDTHEVSIFFSLDRGSMFSDRDQEILNAVAGPLQAGLTNSRRLTRLEECTGILASTLQSVGWNGLVVSPQERILLESPQARSLLVYYFGRDGGGDRLPDSLLRWMRAWANRQREPSAAPPQSAPLSAARGGRHLLIRMLLHPSGYMLLLDEDDDTPRAARLRSFGLSAREAEVLSLIAEGKTGPEISILLGVRHDTVRKHTSRIFEKLGVETRTAAAAMALETTLGKRAP
jgi:DNA-binding CsgD family transcriptional regulator